MTFNKKQMQPLIDKYGINPETNKLFIKVCEMFDGQPNYQIWAARMIFSLTITFEELEQIHTWITNNSNLINKLEKKNVVSYSSKSSIAQLFREIEGLERLGLIKNIISHFNTVQRKILTEYILNKDYTPLEAYFDNKVEKWYDIFKVFSKKPMAIKNKFYSTCSALKSVESLRLAIIDCLKESYVWKEGKEDLLAFIEANAKDCEVVFNEGSCVIVRVPSFESSRKLCGGGRTAWCISREENYFKSYVTSKEGRSQYFLFDFSRKETDAFAHIGFTVECGSGIVEAQTCNNYNMINPYKQGNESLSIFNIFDKLGIKMNMFMKLPKNLGFIWDMSYILKIAKDRPNDFAIAYENDGRLVLNVLNTNCFKDFLKETFIKTNQFKTIDNSNKIYLYMDFNLPVENEKSLIAMQYRKDLYGILSLVKMQDIFGADITNDGYFTQIGFSSDNFLNREAIDPSVLLHKFIDENDEISAIKLIEKEKGNINVNYEFEDRIPIFSAINHKMFKLFDVIIKCDGFDCSTEDGFGETLIHTLLYLIGSDEVSTSREDNELLNNMIKSILSTKTFDFNVKDLNNDTAISIACEYPNEVWVVKELASKKYVDINVVNDFNCSVIDNCICNCNLEALKIIGQRPDLIIRSKTKELAKKFGINLDDYIKPNDSIYANSEEETLDYEFAMEYELGRA